MFEPKVDQCAFQAFNKICRSFLESVQSEAERRAAINHLEHCSSCRLFAEEFFAYYKQNPEEMFVSLAHANDIWEMFEVLKSGFQKMSESTLENHIKFLSKFLYQPEAAAKLIQLMRRMHRVLFFLAQSPVLARGQMGSVRETLIDLKELVGEETLVELLGLRSFDEAVEIWHRLEARAQSES